MVDQQPDARAEGFVLAAESRPRWFEKLMVSQVSDQCWQSTKTRVNEKRTFMERQLLPSAAELNIPPKK